MPGTHWRLPYSVGRASNGIAKDDGRAPVLPDPLKANIHRLRSIDPGRLAPHLGPLE